MRFIHTADWQIGRHYGQFDPEDAAALAEARLDTVATLAARATERGVDAILVAGDVFDLQSVADRTVRRLFSALEGFAGPWVLISGNHDAALADSVWTRARRLGCIAPHVQVAERTGVVALPALDTAVLAAPLTQRHTYDDATAPFDTLDTPAGWLRIGLAHGSVAGRLPDSADLGNPIAADRAQRARLDYLALGDWHGCLEIDARTWYAGTPEPDRFRGNAPGAVLDVRLDAPGALPVVERLEVGRFRWSALVERIVVPADVERIAARLAQAGATDVLQLAVSGAVSVDTWDRLRAAVDAASARVRSLRFDAAGLDLQPDQADLAALGASGYVVDVAHALQALQDDPERGDVAREALRLLLQFEQDGVRAAGRDARA
ncbi:MAG: metallophosphoesterase family protein [Janthinobacterium lividum]